MDELYLIVCLHSEFPGRDASKGITPYLADMRFRRVEDRWVNSGRIQWRDLDFEPSVQDGLWLSLWTVEAGLVGGMQVFVNPEVHKGTTLTFLPGALIAFGEGIDKLAQSE